MAAGGLVTHRSPGERKAGEEMDAPVCTFSCNFRDQYQGQFS